MKPSAFFFQLPSLVVPTLICLAGSASAQLYWDTNGATPGSTSGDSGSGANTWGQNNVWSTSAAGDVATVGYTQGSDVVISAGTDATSSSIIRINGAQSANGITFEEGTITLSSGNTSGGYQANGGSLSIGAGGFTLTNGLHGTAIIATGLGTLTLTADQSWTNNTSTVTTPASTARTFEVQTGVAGNATTGLTRTLTITGPASGTNGGTLISGIISDGTGGGNLAITKAGSQTTILSGANTYTGLTRVDAGILRVSNSSGLGTATTGTEVGAGGSLRLENNITVTGETLRITGVANSGNNLGLVNLGGTNTWTGAITLDTSVGQNTRISASGGTLNLTGSINITSTGSTAGGFGLVVTGDGGTINISGNITGDGNNQNLIKNGASTLVLSGTNTYTGVTRIDAGVLSVASVATNLGGTGSINLGEGGTTGTFRYTGTGETVSRTFTLRPNGSNTGGGRIEQSGTGNLVIGAISASAGPASGSVVKNITLQGSTAGTGQVTGNISNGSATSPTSLTKDGTGTWTLSNTAKDYTGATTVNNGTLNVTTQLMGTTALDIGGGTLSLATADRLFNAATVNLRAGGTLQTGGNETFAALTVRGPSNLDLSLGSSILNFANSSSADWTGGLLTILGWNGTTDIGGGAEQVVFGSDATGLTGTQLSQIQFSLVDGLYSAKILASGEIVPDALIPEPSATLLALLGGAGLIARRRRTQA